MNKDYCEENEKQLNTHSQTEEACFILFTETPHALDKMHQQLLLLILRL